MKSIVKKLWLWVEGINGILFIIYTIFIFSTYAFISSQDNNCFIRWAFIFAVLSVIVCPVILRTARKININLSCEHSLKRQKKDIKWDILFFIIPFLFFFSFYIIYYPGGVYPDTISQYKQCVENNYNDWHPVLHTLISLKLPLTLTGGWFGSVALFQIILFSSVICYALCTIKHYTNLKYAVAAMLFVLLNPQTLNISILLRKDAIFSMTILLLMVYALNIFITKGKWMERPVNIVLFILVTVTTTLLRHNAVLFIIPLLAAVAFYISKKTTIAVCTSIILLIVAVKIPLYTLMDVETPGERQTELLGMPMTVIGNVVKYSPEKLDKETRDFAYRVAPKEVWENEYRSGSFNTIKWNPRTDRSVIEEYGAEKVIMMSIKCLKNSPGSALKGFIRLTDSLYTITDNYYYCDSPVVVKNDCGIHTEGIPAVGLFIKKIQIKLNYLFPHLFVYIGSMHLILIISVLARYKLNRKADLRIIMFIMPVFIYNFGTSLLLTGAEDSSRYFYYTFLILPVLLIFLYSSPKDRTGVDDIS